MKSNILSAHFGTWSAFEALCLDKGVSPEDIAAVKDTPYWQRFVQLVRTGKFGDHFHLRKMYTLGLERKLPKAIFVGVTEALVFAFVTECEVERARDGINPCKWQGLLSRNIPPDARSDEAKKYIKRLLAQSNSRLIAA